MPQSLVLALDLGTSGLKAALVAEDGSVEGWASEPVALRVLPGGGAEQEPEDWWQALRAACAQLWRTVPDAPSRVVAVCPSTQGEGTIPVDASGTPLMPCVLWMDMRGAPHLRRQFGGRVRHQGMGVQHIQRWLRYTGGMPSPTGKDPAAHMLWIRDEHPEVYERTATFLNVLDYVDLRLTGRAAASYDSILTSWVTDNRDPDGVRYHPELVARCGIDAGKLPEIVRCTDVLGPLTASAAADLGLGTDVRVVAGAIDTTAAAIGAGTTGDRDVHLYIGTSSWMAAHVPAKRTDPLAGIASVPCAVPGRYLMTALQATAGGNLTWLRDNVFQPTDELAPALTGGELPDAFAAFDAMVGRVPPGARGVVYTPWLYGERAPVDDLSLRAGLFNLSLHHTREDVVKAVYEGIALNTRWLMKPVRRFLGTRPSSIAFVGGGAQSRAWSQVLADTLDVEVRRLADPVMANARGAAFIARVGLGELTFDDVPGLVQVAETLAPRPEAVAVMDERFATFRTLHKHLAPVYRDLATTP